MKNPNLTVPLPLPRHFLPLTPSHAASPSHRVHRLSTRARQATPLEVEGATARGAARGSLRRLPPLCFPPQHRSTLPAPTVPDSTLSITSPRRQPTDGNFRCDEPRMKRFCDVFSYFSDACSNSMLWSVDLWYIGLVIVD
jgi:hypothetical protein